MTEPLREPAPWHLWPVGLLALLFTAFGGYDYVMSQLGDRDYMAAVTGGMGVDVDVAVAYFAGFPLWLDFAWAIGVWGAVAGSILLLRRRRWAVPAFAVSLVAFVVTNSYGIANPLPGMQINAMTLGPVLAVFVVLLLLTLYARAMARRGVLGPMA
ncbi:hypothetical protein GRI62_02715 [Erythrobacter arachoides]|uniref:Sugar transporter n=1 Tax=Aurantiacibacter arachoides TaxID=1850444 RepID=A0A845A0L6_9SPHN|nr:hypothetical protein [Aurantiacibacter arachoides]MXO92517.1 hypothetical protein [Aurantiacibacter arachoides]GGD56550.1 hypothetical protein GCM10011411_15720 [Aurantiacibacter arachoides]